MQVKKKYKSFEYCSKLKWIDEKIGEVDFGNSKPKIEVATPPEFGGHEGFISPEDLLLASISSCAMTTFLAFCHRFEVKLVSMEASASAKVEFVEKGFKFTQAKVQMEVVVEDEVSIQPAQEAIRKAHHYCLISASLNFPVEVNGMVRIPQKNR